MFYYPTRAQSSAFGRDGLIEGDRFGTNFTRFIQAISVTPPLITSNTIIIILLFLFKKHLNSYTSLYTYNAWTDELTDVGVVTYKI